MDGLARPDTAPERIFMKIAAIAGSTIPSDTANSIQVMKACGALAQLGHNLTLIVPGNPKSSIENLKSHYGLQTEFSIEWLASSSRRMFTWDAVRRARALGAELVYSWFPQSAVFGLLRGLPVVFEIHIQPTGTFGPIWHRAFRGMRGRKRLVSITDALLKLLERDFNMRFPAEQVVIAPNGVDLERFDSLPDSLTARRQTGLREAPTVMCTGHLYAGRGAELFLELAASLPQAQFVWVGGRPEDIAVWKQRGESENVLLYRLYSQPGSAPVSGCRRYSADALQPIHHGIQRLGRLCRGCQPDEDVRIYGGRTGDRFIRSAGDPGSVE
jgi:glycosyltransferase involved in cell wall biosynthesis